MRFFLFLLALLLPLFRTQDIHTDMFEGLIDQYANCQVMIESFHTVFWTINGGTLEMAISAATPGYAAVGFSRVFGSGMLNTDAVLGYVTGNGTVVLMDMFLSLSRTPCNTMIMPPRGVCTDLELMGVDDVTIVSGEEVAGNVTGTTLTRLQFTRPLMATDPNLDLTLTAGTAEYLAAVGFSDVLVQHDLRVSRNLDLFSTPACPQVLGAMCGGNGICMNGCCICNPGFFGADCAPEMTGGSGDLSLEEGAYDFCSDLDGSFRLCWIIDQNTNVITMLVIAQTSGWIAFGPSSDGLMLDSDVVFAWVTSSGEVFVDDYFITARQAGCPGVCLDTDSSLNGMSSILDFAGMENAGETRVAWRRALDTADSSSDLPITDSLINAVFAYSPNEPLSPDSLGPQHDASARNAIQINFFTGEVSVNFDLRPTHGWLMFIAWAIIIPLTAQLARYWKKYVWWFPAHWGLNLLAMFLTLASFMIILFGAAVHFEEAHQIIGLVVVFLSVGMPALGILADRLYEPDRESPPFWPDGVHKYLGWFLWILAVINIVLGMILYESPTWLIILYGIYACLLFSGMGACCGFCHIYQIKNKGEAIEMN